MSAELELRLQADDKFLRLYDLRTGERVLAPEEWYDLARKAQEQARHELERAERAERRAEAAEAEAARLRSLLEKLPGDKGQ